MITLEQLNLNEEELDGVLCNIFEKDDEKDHYHKFIKEDATLDQKLALFEQQKSKFYSMIENMAYNCRQEVGGKTFERQMGVVECNQLEAVRMLGTFSLFQESDALGDEWLAKLEANEIKLETYLDKFGDQLSESVYKTIMGVILLQGVGWVAYRAIRAAMSEKSRRCGILGIGRERDVCMWKVKAEAAKKMAALLSREQKTCSQSPNPEKCKAKSKSEIDKNLKKAKKLEDKIRKYKGKSINKAMKGQAGEAKAKDPTPKPF